MIKKKIWSLIRARTAKVFYRLTDHFVGNIGAVISGFGIGFLLIGFLFVCTAGHDIAYPQKACVKFLPLVWKFTSAEPAGLSGLWSEFLSGIMSGMCLLGRLIIFGITGFATGYILTRPLCWIVFVHRSFSDRRRSGGIKFLLLR